jgi:ethanolamine utilization protein EutA (predicted chaperonin)
MSRGATFLAAANTELGGGTAVYSLFELSPVTRDLAFLIGGQFVCG